MATTSALELQALDIGVAIMQGAAQGQWPGQISKGQVEAIGAAIALLSTAVGNIKTALAPLAATMVTATIGVTLTAANQNALNNSTTPGAANGAFTTTATNVSGQWALGTSLASMNGGTTAIATQLP